MNARDHVDRWARSEPRHFSRALFSSRWAGYFASTFARTVVVRIATAGLHVAHTLIAMRGAGGAGFAHVVTLGHLAWLLLGAWNAILDRLRTATPRASERSRDEHWSAACAIAVTLAGVAFWARSWHVLSWYGAIVLLRAALDVILRTLNAALPSHARGRAMDIRAIAGDAVGVAAFFVCAPTLGGRASLAALSAAVTFSRLLSLRALWNAHLASHVPFPRLDVRSAWRCASSVARDGGSLAAAIAAIVARWPSVFAIAFEQAAHGEPDSLIAIQLVAIPLSPLAGVGQALVGDFRALGDRAYRTLRGRFAGRARVASLAIGLGLGAAGGAIAAWLGESARRSEDNDTLFFEAPFPSLWFVVGIAALGGALALYSVTDAELRAAQRTAARLVRSTLASAFAAVAFSMATVEAGGPVCLALALGFALLSIRRAPPQRAAEGVGHISIGAWIADAHERNLPTRQRRTMRIHPLVRADALSRRFGQRALLARYRRTLFLSGDADLFARLGLLSAISPAVDVQNGSTTVSVASRFHALFPDGEHIDLGSVRGSFHRESPLDLWFAFERAARGLRGRTALSIVSTLLEDGTVRHVFAIPRSASEDRKRLWHGEIERTFASQLGAQISKQ